MSTGVTCEVFVDGRRVADGSPGDNPLDPTALSGLTIAWGRETTVDQPDAATCEFEILDDLGGDSFLGTFRTGQTVEVTATGTLWPVAAQETFADPSFEAAPLGSTPPGVFSGGLVTVTDERAHTGAQSALMTPDDAALVQRAVFAPEALSAAPDAWDDIAATEPGQTWTLAAAVWAPEGSSITVTPVVFTRPDGTHTLDTAAAFRTTGTGDWVEVSRPYVPTVYGAWLGVAVAITDRPRWVDVPGTWAATPGTWRDRAVGFADDVSVLSPEGGQTRTVLVFSGRITDLSATYDDGADAPVVHVTAADFTADLENIDVGDEPWLVEAMSARFNRILDLSEFPVTATIDDRPGALLMSWQDVDSQGTAGLLKDLAQSTDAVMWAAVHQTTGPYLWVEDPSARKSLLTLAENSGGLVVIVPSGSFADAQTISACDILRDPIEWIQDVADVSTRVAVSWLEQTVDDEGNPDTVEHTFTLVDADLESEYGKRRMQVSTILQSEPDASDIATRLLARTHITDWRASGVTIDDPDSLEVADDAATRLLLRLLDGTARIGLPIRLTDLPEWSPAGSTLPVYLEGGDYAFEDGAWTLALTVSRAAALGTSTSWEDVAAPAWRWIDFDPSIEWIDLFGVEYPPA